MRKTILLGSLLFLAGLAGCIGDSDVDTDGDGVPDDDELEAGTDPFDPLSFTGVTPLRFGDVTVLAIVDSGFNPYHWDFLADHMPQHQDDDPSNNLPLNTPPHRWIPGFPEPESFDSYEALELTLTPDDPDADPSCVPGGGGNIVISVPPSTSEPTVCDDEEGGLYQQDSQEWETVQQSDLDTTHYQWIPGTKIIGYLNFGGGTGFGVSSHGVGTTSVSVGNIHGSCPECLLLFINSFDDDANVWMARQPWIDVQSNSWGASTGYRENIWTDCDLEELKAGVERGQQIFWSAGNGQANAFVAPVNTLNSCQKGPDYLVTVGAIDPDTRGSFTGHGKPVDVSSWGSGYPSAYGGNGTVTAEGSFSGTSNAAPTTAGLYAKALWSLRNQLGTERIQEAGVIATGPAGCGAANPDCALADGEVTVHEFRSAFLRAATHTDAYFTDPVVGLPVPGNAETEYFTEGHGSFFAHLGDIDQEVATILAEVTGDAYDAPSQDLIDYMTAYSYCSQQVWIGWDHGYWKAGDPLPAEEPGKPVQTWLATACPDTMNAVLAPFRA